MSIENEIFRENEEIKLTPFLIHLARPVLTLAGKKDCGKALVQQEHGLGNHSASWTDPEAGDQGQVYRVWFILKVQTSISLPHLLHVSRDQLVNFAQKRNQNYRNAVVKNVHSEFSQQYRRLQDSDSLCQDNLSVAASDWWDFFGSLESLESL